MNAAMVPLSPTGIPGLLEQLGMSSSSWQYTTAEVLAARWFPHTDAAIPLVVDEVHPEQSQPVVAALARAYPAGHGVWTISHDDAGNACQPSRYRLEEVGDAMRIGSPHTLLIPPLAEECSLTQLPNILARLRAPDGCPWDREQTLESLRFQVVSEVHEVIEAIDLQDDENLAEELGDLLLDTFFLINIGYEQGRFHMAEVLAEISRKMIRRHPHVFGDSQLEDSDSVLKEWDQIKQAEYRAKGKQRGPLDGIAKGLPALEGARLMQSRTRKAGEDPDAHASNVNVNGTSDAELELGQRLWHLVADATEAGINPEDALRRFNSLYRQSVQGSEPPAGFPADDAQEPASQAP